MVLQFIFFIFFILVFIRSKNIIITLLVFFLLLFYIQVSFSEYLFGMDFSPSTHKFNGNEPIFYSLTIFTFLVALFNYNIDTNFAFKTNFKSFRMIDIIPFIFIIGFATFLLLSKGIRIDGSFIESKGVRTIIEDYVFIPIILTLFLTRARFLIVLAIIVLLMSYFLAGERMRMFLYLFALYFMFTNEQNSVKFRIYLLIGFFFATLISLMRSSFAVHDTYHITHFGSVTISSLYLLEYTNHLDIFDKFKYFLGIIIGNIIPSSFLPEGFDIRRDLVAYAEIPGGGWFPVWFYALGGYTGLIAISLLVAILIRKFSRKIKTSPNKMILLFFIVLTATLPRWFMYTPYQFIRFPLYIMLAYILYVIFKKNVGVQNVRS